MSENGEAKRAALVTPMPKVIYRCPHCGKVNPAVGVHEMGMGPSGLVLMLHIADCCKKILNGQLIAVAQKPGLIVTP